MNDLTQRGIAALKAGDRAAARQWLSAALRQNPADLQAWLWLSGAVDRDEERLDCLVHMQHLDPGNQVAARGITQLLEKTPRLSSKVKRLSRAFETAPQQAAPSPAAAAETARDGETSIAGAGDDSLLDRAILAALPPATPYIRPASQAPDMPAVEAAPAPAPAPIQNTDAGARAIPIIYPRGPRQNYNAARPVFHSRPSLVPVILYFWMVVFLLYGTLVITGQWPEIEITFPVVAALSIVCGLVTVYMLIRLFTTHYNLTTQSLSLPYFGQKIEVPLSLIINVETQQSAFQKFLGTGDILFDASLGGVLSRLSVRNIPQVQQRAEQLLHLLNDLR